MANQPYYEDLGYKRRQPLKYRTGSEIIDSIVLASDVISADSAGRKLLAAGELVCKITSGSDANKYGPYLKTASDGRESISVNAACFLVEGHDIALGDQTGAGFIAFAAFDKSELTMNGCSLHGTPLTTLKAAFPNCEFLD